MCASWNGDFGSRRKREVGEAETEEEASNVPSVMESGSSALGWLKAAVRKTRSAAPGNANKKPPKGKKKSGRKNKARNQRRKGRKGGRSDAKKSKGKRIRKLEGEGGKGEKVVEVMQRNLKGRRKKLKGIRIRKLEGEGGKGEKVAEVTQRNLKGRRKNLEGIRRKGGKEERKIKITGVSQKKEKETGKTRNLHQRRKIMEVKGREKERRKMVVEMEEIMVWQNQLTTSFGVLIFHWSRFGKNVWKIR